MYASTCTYGIVYLLCQMQSCLHLLRGQVYEALENRHLACECFREALRHDVYCYEALDSLVMHQMMTAQEGQCTYACTCTHTHTRITILHFAHHVIVEEIVVLFEDL